MRRSNGPPRLLANRSAAAAFLCYHAISDDAPAPLAVRPATFERQLAALRRWGYRAGGLATLRALTEGERRAGAHVFLTFDDGFRDGFTTALPLLEAYGYRALVFVLPPLLDDGGPLAWPELGDLPRRHPETFRSLSWEQVEAMSERGVEFGSHTCRHRRLDALGDEELHHELFDSRTRLRERLGRCDAVAFPFGAASARVVAAARAAGYRFGFTLPYGALGVGGQHGFGPLAIPRIAIDERDGERRLRLKLSTGGRRMLLSPLKGAVRAIERAGAPARRERR